MERSIKRLKKPLSDPGQAPDSSLAWPAGGGQGVNRFTDNFAVMGLVLQQPAAFFEEVRNGVNLAEKIWMLLASSTVFLAVYGIVLGTGHIFLSLGAALAMPVLFLGSLLTCMPVMYLLDVLTGSQRSLGQMAVVLLTSMSAAAMVFFSFTPIMILFRVTGSIEGFFLLNLAILGIATIAGLFYITQGLLQTAMIDDSHHLSRVNRRLHLLWMFLFLVVSGQMAWGLLTFFERTGGFIGLLL